MCIKMRIRRKQLFVQISLQLRVMCLIFERKKEREVCVLLYVIVELIIGLLKMKGEVMIDSRFMNCIVIVKGFVNCYNTS